MSQADRSVPPSVRSGFTLVEIMIGAALGSMVLLGIMTTYLLLLRSGISASNYAVMESQARRTFEQLGIDARMASRVTSTLTGTTVTQITLTVPNNYVSNSNKVTYAFDSTNQWFYVVPGDGTAYVVPGAGTVPVGQQILIRSVASAAFNRYDLAHAATTSDSATRHVQLAITVRRSAVRVVAETETILSAAFTLRN
jgi:prepilin-type N-terminal cleavage/methylation domain-containing protein